MPFCYKSLPFAAWWDAGRVKIKDSLYDVHLVSRQRYHEDICIDEAGSVKQGLRNQAAQPEKAFNTRWKKHFVFPLSFCSFNKVSIIFVCFGFVSFSCFVVLCSCGGNSHRYFMGLERLIVVSSIILLRIWTVSL